MAYILRKRNRLLWIFITFSIFSTALFLPLNLQGDIIFYDPEIDISLGMFNYLFNEDDIVPPIEPGIYFGGYFSLKSRFFSDFFNTEKLYSIFEAGVAISGIENEDVAFITIPLHVDIGYQIRLLKKLYFLPTVGTGLHITYNESLGDPAYSDQFKDEPHLSPIIGTGFELKWAVFKNSSLKVKFNYGLIFDGRVQSGYAQYFQIRFPVPFIP